MLSCIMCVFCLVELHAVVPGYLSDAVWPIVVFYLNVLFGTNCNLNAACHRSVYRLSSCVVVWWRQIQQDADRPRSRFVSERRPRHFIKLTVVIAVAASTATSIYSAVSAAGQALK